MTFRTNQVVVTKTGSGTVQGVYSDGRWIVRLPVNPETKKLDHCLTPKAQHTGLWTFKESELK